VRCTRPPRRSHVGVRDAACDNCGMDRRLVLVCGGAGLALGAISIETARTGPSYSFGGGTAFAAAVELVAGYGLLAAGLVAVARHGQRRLGAILLAGSAAWFLLEWNNPAAPASVFTFGLVFYAASPPLVAHAMLAYPDGRVRSAARRVVVAVAYTVSLLLLGVLAATTFDPRAGGCADCPRNLLLVHGDRALYETLNHVGIDGGVFWTIAATLVAAVALVRSTPPRRRLVGPVTVAGCAYLGLVAADFVHSVARGYLGNDALDRRLWLGEAAAVIALALGVASSWVMARRRRARVARVVLELAGAPPAGGLREALAGSLGDPSLDVGYPLGDGRVVDARGRSFQPTNGLTPIVRDGREVALLAHRPGLLDDPTLVEEVGVAARLMLENERLHTQAQAQLEDLRMSRTRLVDAADRERRRLERDLHDGAQQRLVGLALELRLARSQLGAEADPAVVGRIEEADREVRLALADLRRLAHGIFPAVLADEGLGAALESLAEEAPTPIELTALPTGRFDPPVETAAYFVAAKAVLLSAGLSRVGAQRLGDRLVVEIETERVPGELVELEDRIGAVNGAVSVERDGEQRVTIRAEIPCGS
jgi:signal transduction histidine kinase